MYIDDIRSQSNSLDATRRNPQNYDIDVALGNQSATGIKEYSILNRIPHFHVTESTSVDVAHDIAEGILHTILSLSIHDFIKKSISTLVI